MTKGFVLGKFMPPHLGHVMLCDFARHYCDELTILVCTRAVEPIEGLLRAKWMQALFPDSRIVHFFKDVPQEPSEHPDFWDIWRNIVREAQPAGVDFLFASEDYGSRLAQEVGATFVPFDRNRVAVPISGTQIRENIFRHWDFLPPPVQEHYTKTVCLFGPESTGKSTLARQLAERLKTIAIPEYGRIYCEMFGTDCDANDLRRIIRGQDALNYAGRRRAHKILIQDTDTVMTTVWAEMFNIQLPEIEISSFADLYLLCDIDIPWKNDGTRYFPDRSTRQLFFDRSRNALERRKLPFVVIGGDEQKRLTSAMTAITSHFPGLAAQ